MAYLICRKIAVLVKLSEMLSPGALYIVAKVTADNSRIINVTILENENICNIFCHQILLN